MAQRRIEHLLVGGGIASVSAARTLREQGAQGSIAIVGRELDAPYHRPPISKGYLQGTETREQALLFAEQWYADNEIELLTRTSVLELDLDARVAKLSTREELEFGTALLATGAMVRRLSVEGAGLDGVHYLRTLGNADAIRREAQSAEQVVLIGGSYIACEVAATLTVLGCHCTMVMLEGVALERSFGPLAARFFHDTLTRHGVTILESDEVQRLEGTGEDPQARVRAVATKSGRELPADLVVAGVGVQPDVTLARKAGLAIGDLGGVRVDSRLQTAVSGVYAAGDIAEYDSVIHGRVMRIEHEDVAAQQGRTVALNMLGEDRPHDVVPYFFSDLADWASLEYVGPASQWDEEIVRGSPEAGRFSHWYLDAGRVVAVLAVDSSGDIEHGRRLLSAGRTLGEERAALADLDADLARLGG